MTPSKMEATTFHDLNIQESEIEEMLRQNVDMICDGDEGSMLIVGQQVCNAQNGRSDLTAIDSDGNIVLIELKRDKASMTGRKEALEFQAIRYAASYATIGSEDELIQNVFAPYVNKHRAEFPDPPELTPDEVAARQLNDFMQLNNIKAFNTKQRIILTASEFDEQTLSAVAWLSNNNVDISCYQMCPYKFNDSILIDMKKILPIVDYDDYYVDIAQKGITRKRNNGDISRRTLPKINDMLTWGIVSAGDIICAKDHDEEAVLQADGSVDVRGDLMSLQQWLKRVFGWSAVETYAFSVDKKTGKTLKELRKEYMDKQAESADDTAQIF